MTDQSTAGTTVATAPQIGLKAKVAQYGIYVASPILVIFFMIGSGVFLTSANLLIVLQQVSIIGTCAVGLAFFLLTGGIDLSVRSVIGVAGMTRATLAAVGFPVVLAVTAALGFGLAAGLLAGFIINAVGIPPLITTLGLMTAFRGVSCIIRGGLPLHGVPDGLKQIGQSYPLGVPDPVIPIAVTLVLRHVLLTCTCLGCELYGVGGNEAAARLSGVNGNLLKYNVYALGTTLAAFTGIVLLARVNSGQPKGGEA